ncbi:unnamed protein product [Paramecium primaurelia]|uniref:Protein kinase domain-containing protein n=1 Tax=Paramecium primaurelia TaxID=5886 RepID=A0A8S1ND05_PARPR|nr:unnamed protein product [Paramecium primaurelia]
MIQDSYEIENLTKCQIEQVEALMKNLDKIKSENFVFFPNDLIIEKQEKQYEFTFTEQNISLIGERSQKLLLQQQKSIHNSKHILLLLNRLSKLNIYLPTLTQESFLMIKDDKEASERIGQTKQNMLQKSVLYKFSLEKLHQNTPEIKNNHCLSPELINSIHNSQQDGNNIIFTEKMAIFNIGCILFELFTLQKLYQRESSFQDNCKYALTKYIFVPGFKYDSFLFGQLVQKCTLEEETELNRRFTFQEALDQIIYIEQCVKYIDRAKLEQVSISIDDFFSQKSSLNDKLVESLQMKVNHQVTGRLYILQNLIRMKFVYILFQEKKLECFRDFLLLKLIIQELQELKKFDLITNQPLNKQNDILNFKDSLDEIKEFQTHYSSKYQQILFQLIKGIDEHKYNEISQTHFKQQFRLSKVQDFQKDFHADLFQQNNPKQELFKLCLQNINSIFLQDKLTIYFKPIFMQLIIDNPYKIYDNLLSILFGNEIQDNKIQEIIQTIKLNSNQS